MTINYQHTWGMNNAHAFVVYGYAYYILNRYESIQNNSPRIIIGNTDRRWVTFTKRFLKVADGWGNTRYLNYDKSALSVTAAMQLPMTTVAVEVYK